MREKLNFGKSVIMLDFAENYSFLVQDAAQGFHWNNAQATIHPFVIYYADGSGKLAHKSYLCISDHKTHDTITLYSFLKHQPYLLHQAHLKEHGVTINSFPTLQALVSQ